MNEMVLSSEQQLIEQDIEAFLARHQAKELLRFVTVGSVDDGKSTLIGRLLYDTRQVYDDQLSAVRRASAKRETEIDFSLFTDGLKAEREQGITIDVAYRYFATEKRKFIIADTPGHVQYTRNMATGASTANVALILIDARLGVLQQSRRHAYIAALLGIPHLIVCVNKMDLVDFAEGVYEPIRAEFGAFAARLGFKDVTFLPVSAKGGDNVALKSERTPWYDGPTLLEYLESVPIAADRNHTSFRFPVQYVLRPNLDYRAFAGEIASGVVREGDTVTVLPSRRTSRVVGIDTFDGGLQNAFAPMSVALRLADEIDISRGDMLVHPDDVPRVARRLDAMLVWMSERPIDLKKSYLVKHTTRYVRAQVESITHLVDLETLSEVPAERMELNEIGRVRLVCHQPLYVDAYDENRSTGAFILVDTLTNNTVAAGMILDAGATDARESDAADVSRQSQVSPDERRERLGQRGVALLLRGPSAEPVNELVYALERRLHDLGRVVYALGPHELTNESRSLPDVVRALVDAELIVVLPAPAPGAEDELARAVGEARLVRAELAEPRDSSRVVSGALVLKLEARRGAYERAVEQLVAGLTAHGFLSG